MKIRVKITAGIVIIIALGVVYLFRGAMDTDKAMLAVKKTRAIVTEKGNDGAAEDAPSIKGDAEKLAKIQSLKEEAQQQYLEIIQLSGATGQPNMSYEDNWCIASEDLSEEEAIYAKQQLGEWQLSRGIIIPRGGRANALMQGLGVPNDEFPGVNDEYLTPYKEADRETLLRLANGDDMLALTTILNSKGYETFDVQTKLTAAKRLVVLGDTSKGLRELVIDGLVNAQHAKPARGEEQVYHLKVALTYIEYGMLRQDASSLDIVLDTASNYEEDFSGIDPSTLLTEQDFADIKQWAQSYYDDVNKVRIDKGLPSFEDIDNSKIEQIEFAKTLSYLYRDYSALLKSDLFPPRWKNTYLKKTPCLERRVAMHNFRDYQLPAINDEIAKLERELNLTEQD